MRLPLQPKLQLTRQETGAQGRYQRSAGIYNGIVNPGETAPYTAPRPLFSRRSDASEEASTPGAQGRGIKVWDFNTIKYVVNDTEVFQNLYSVKCTGDTLTSSVNRVYMAEVGNYLCIIDTTNDEGFTINSSTPTVVAQIVDVDFPTNLARGTASLKGRLYLLAKDGTVYNSDSEDPTSWDALNFLNAEMESDSGQYIIEFNEEIVVFGTRTIQYFWHAANPTASPLSPRQDVFHNIGTATYPTVAKHGDALYFVGVTKTGNHGIYRMVGHAIEKISPPDLDLYLSTLDVQAIATDRGIQATICSVEGRAFYLLSLHPGATKCETYAYDTATDYWYEWEYTEADLGGNLTGFPAIDWSETTAGPYSAFGLMTNGDIVAARSDINDDNTEEIPAVTILTGNQSFETNKEKFMSNASVDSFITHADREQTSQTAQLRFYDEGEVDTAGTVTHDIELMDRHVGGAGESNVVSRAGCFRKRNFELVVPTDATVTRTEIYALDFDLKVGL